MKVDLKEELSDLPGGTHVQVPDNLSSCNPPAQAVADNRIKSHMGVTRLDIGISLIIVQGYFSRLNRLSRRRRPSEKHNTGANAAATVETAKYQPFAYTSAFKASYRPSENLPLPQQIFRMQSFQL